MVSNSLPQCRELVKTQQGHGDGGNAGTPDPLPYDEIIKFQKLESEISEVRKDRTKNRSFQQALYKN